MAALISLILLQAGGPQQEEPGRPDGSPTLSLYGGHVSWWLRSGRDPGFGVGFEYDAPVRFLPLMGRLSLSWFPDWEDGLKGVPLDISAFKLSASGGAFLPLGSERSTLYFEGGVSLWLLDADPGSGAPAGARASFDVGNSAHLSVGFQVVVGEGVLIRLTAEAIDGTVGGRVKDSISGSRSGHLDLDGWIVSLTATFGF